MQKATISRKGLALFFLAILVLALPSGCGREPTGGPADSIPTQGQERTGTGVEKIGVTEVPGPVTEGQSAPHGESYQAGSSDQEGSRAGPTERGEPGEPETGLKLLPARVTRVVDGDTVYVRLDDGTEEKVRFIGMDTPESTTQVEPYGKEAVAYTKSRLDGKKVYLELDVGERDKYGRLLAYVWLELPKDDSGAEVRAKMFNAELLLAGMAQVMTVPPNVKYADLFVKFQREAREAGKGLWGLPAGSETIAPEGTPKEGGDAAPDYYVGSANSDKFHRPKCERAQKIKPENLVRFESRDDTVAAGYKPCQVCRP